MTTNGNVTATYDARDNKIRLYSVARLGSGEFARIKAAGFAWAPKQQCFVAPAWTPDREDIALEFAGSIDDEQSTPEERAEQRAERFERYSDNRKRDATQALEQAQAIGERFSGGQPILIGHHSEKRARKDQERMHAAARRAANAWETAEYWQHRARASVRAAAYKERPDVRARRIHGLGADARKVERNAKHARKVIDAWQRINDTGFLRRKDGSESDPMQRALYLANNGFAPYGMWGALTDGNISVEEAAQQTIEQYSRSLEWFERWAAHYANRIAFERACLEAEGMGNGAAHAFQEGGRVRIGEGEQWYVIRSVTRRDGAVVGLRVVSNRNATSRVLPDSVSAYEPPTDESAQAVRATKKSAVPMVNYPGEGYVHITREQWSRIHADYKGSRIVVPEGAPKYRVRTAMTGSLRAIGATVAGTGYGLAYVYITDSRRSDPPVGEPAPAPVLPRADRALCEPSRDPIKSERDDAPNIAEAARAILAQKPDEVRASPTLYPTPTALAHRMVALADIREEHTVLEPSAGTGALVDACMTAFPRTVVAVEVDTALADRLARKYADTSGVSIVCGDFLSFTARTLGAYDRVIMNPPFNGAADIEHVQHARSMLKPGGVLVAIVANGPRQEAALRPIASDYIPLEDGTFRDSGTMVRTALVRIVGEAGTNWDAGDESIPASVREGGCLACGDMGCEECADENETESA